MSYRDQPLGELALSIPRASALFRKYDMVTAAAVANAGTQLPRVKSMI